ncbi:MAG TPA: saccharopine dehydrogenase NADP-binding domain-containing protein [Haliangiales bacterium]|nr:saccharopine dehydrogenase NADP-binding domain-containing protein [Haliangiales bacterium]
MNGRDSWLLYGANGYTGVLVAEEAKRRGMNPILAGRREGAVRPIAERLGFEWRAFELTPDALRRGLDGAGAVLLCAGPFSVTSAPVVEACLAARAHYLDITGEIDVFEACAARAAAAERAGVTVFPGVGFDVVPSDCLALRLKEALPDAVELDLAFYGEGTPSAGTAKTAVEGMVLGGRARRDGRIVELPLGGKKLDVPFTSGVRRAVSIPWGDVSTAYRSTGIPNITAYTVVSPAFVHLAPVLRGALRVGFVRRAIGRWIERTVHGPDEKTRATARSHLWGRVTDAAGRTRSARLDTPEGYALTAVTALECTRRALAGKIRPGYTTPALAFGSGFIAEFPGCAFRLD